MNQQSHCSADTRPLQQEFWAAVDDQVQRVTGYSCGTPEKHWWCPKAGFTLEEGVHLFTTETAALDVAVAVAERELARRVYIVEKLKARRNDNTRTPDSQTTRP